MKRSASIYVSSIDVFACVQERDCRAWFIAERGSPMERSPAVPVTRVRIRPGGQQQFDDFRIAALRRRPMKRGDTISVSRVRVGTILETLPYLGYCRTNEEISILPTIL